MPRFPSTVCVENSLDARHDRERKNIIKETEVKAEKADLWI